MGNDGVQVSQVYQTMKISNLTNMISFFDFSVVEKLAVDAVKYNFVQVKVDHLKGVVSFGSQVSILAAALSGILTEVFLLGWCTHWSVDEVYVVVSKLNFLLILSVFVIQALMERSSK